jgi:sugar/nucleoside kinase (ribokinase family)
MSGKRDFDVIACGAYFMDLVFTGFPRMPHPGEELYGSGFCVRPGGAYNTVLALHRLGVRVGWAVDLGSDIWSRMVLEEAEREGIDTSLFVRHRRPLRSVTVSVCLPEDRGFITYMDPDPPVPAAIGAISRCRTRILFIPALYHGPFFAIGEKAVRRSGTLVFMDGNSSSGTLAHTKGIAEALRKVDVFLPNRAEALRLAGLSGPADQEAEETALSLLSEHTPVVVMKRGKEGATALWDGRRYSVPAARIQARGRSAARSKTAGCAPGIATAGADTSGTDTTGAGDFFDGGFMKGWLDGKQPEECLAWAVSAGTAALSCADEKRTGFSLDRVARDAERILRGARTV